MKNKTTNSNTTPCNTNFNNSNVSSQTTTMSSSLNILQFNCNGLTRKIDEIIHFMTKNEIQIAAIQETKLSTSSKLLKRGEFTIIRQDRKRNKGGGIAFLIHDKVQYRTTTLPAPMIPDTHLEQLGIIVRSGETEIKIINVYVPPQSSCEAGYRLSIDHLLQIDDCIIAGDLNAHHQLWHSNLSNDQRGEELADQIDSASFGVINEDAHTRVTANSNSSPDVTLASFSLLTATDWRVETALNSDHLPIIITLNKTVAKIYVSGRTYTNFAKTNWQNFTAYTEDRFKGSQDGRVYVPEPLATQTATKGHQNHSTTYVLHRFFVRGAVHPGTAAPYTSCNCRNRNKPRPNLALFSLWQKNKQQHNLGQMQRLP